MTTTGPTPAYRKRLSQLAAGAASGAITKTSIAPLERVKILLQIQGMHTNLEPKYKGIFHTAKTVVTEEGMIALYKGNGANVLRIVPTYALKFAFNDSFKDMVAKGQTTKLSFTQLICSGTLAGLFQITITYPLELVRTRLTLSEGMKQGVQFKGIADCAQQTIKKEGFSALYKGISPTWLSGAPYVGLQMTFFEVFKGSLSPLISSATVATLASGACAGIVAQTITYPGDTVRRRMQTNGIGGTKRIYSNFVDCTMKAIRTEGPLSLYKGLSANTIRCIPGAAIQFWTYETLKTLLGAR